MSKPKVDSSVQKELEQVQNQFDSFEKSVNELTLDRMNEAPIKEMEPQTKLSQKDISKSNDIYLKPHTSIGCREKFNEAYREQYNFDKEYVQFVAENKEIIGESIELWTRPYAGMPAEFWKVPVNKPVWGPRYLAEQIKRKSYHRLVMNNAPTEVGTNGTTFYGAMVADTTIQRLDAMPVSKKKSIFMGAGNF